MTKKLSIFVITIFCTFAIFSKTSFATFDTTNTQITIENLANGDYYETIIETNDETSNEATPLATTKYITKTKTTYYKNSSGAVLWSVSIKATFSYNGSTSKCTSCSHSTTAPGELWSISSSSSSKTGNSATATATAVYKPLSGSSQTFTKSVTIQCSAAGVVS